VSRYALNLPVQLKQEAEQWAVRQGVSLNQFILWAVSEKVGELKQQFDDPNFPQITYRRGVSGRPVPILRNTGIRVQSFVVASQNWGLSIEQIANEYSISKLQVKEALAFYKAHKPELDIELESEKKLEEEHVEAKAAS
jgi:uncharacterized protein (DUF433 family)